MKEKLMIIFIPLFIYLILYLGAIQINHNKKLYDSQLIKIEYDNFPETHCKIHDSIIYNSTVNSWVCCTPKVIGETLICEQWNKK